MILARPRTTLIPGRRSHPSRPRSSIIDEQGSTVHSALTQVTTCPAAMSVQRPRQHPRAFAFSEWAIGTTGARSLPSSPIQRLSRMRANRRHPVSARTSHGDLAPRTAARPTAPGVWLGGATRGSDAPAPRPVVLRPARGHGDAEAPHAVGRARRSSYLAGRDRYPSHSLGSAVTQSSLQVGFAPPAPIIRFLVLQMTVMSPNAKARKRGRPSTHPVDRLRTRLWINVLKAVSGLSTAYALEMALDGHLVRKRDADVARPRKWDAYEKGTKVPFDRPGPRNAVDQAEARFPGAARWFRSPIWWYLKQEPFDARRLEEALRTLEPAVVSILFEAEAREGEGVPRQRPIDDRIAFELAMIASFDALVAAVLLAGMSEVIASPELRERALRVYMSLQSTIIKMPVMEGIYPELLSLIDVRCKHWVYLSPNLRMEAVMFWRTFQQHMEEKADTSLDTVEQSPGASPPPS
ncbi:hypothetical protein [Azospirillum largimobile]